MPNQQTVQVDTNLHLEKILSIFRAMCIMKDEIRCPRCNSKMTDMQACHMICENCGAHLDCSDKGSFW